MDPDQLKFARRRLGEIQRVAKDNITKQAHIARQNQFGNVQEGLSEVFGQTPLNLKEGVIQRDMEKAIHRMNDENYDGMVNKHSHY